MLIRNNCARSFHRWQLAMAATVCYPSHGYGIVKLKQCKVNKDNVTRSLKVSPLLVTSQGSLCFNHCTKKYFSKVNVKLLEANQIRRTSVICTAGHTTEFTSGEAKEDEIDKATLIWRAIKLPIYSVALVPLTVGTAAAYLQTGLCSGSRYLVLLASSVLIITWLNLSNDVYDFDTGADKNKVESVVNIVGSRDGTLLAACLCLALGFMGLAWVSVDAANLRSILLLSSAIMCGYIYQCPPFRLSYQGLGEPLCFAAFGPFATTAFYLLQGITSELPITSTIFSVSMLVGVTTSLILFCSHFHQINEDMTVGKMSPLVRLGTKAGAKVVKMAVVALYSLLLVLGLGRTLPVTVVILCALTIPIAKLVVSYVEENHTDKTKIFMAKYYCVRLHALYGAALAAGLVAARMVTRNYVPNAIFT